MIHATRNTDIAATKNVIKRKLIAPRDQFEEQEFHAWTITLMKDIINNETKNESFFNNKILISKIYSVN